MFFIQRSRQVISPLILLMGGPGCGKGVLASRLAELQHLSIGEKLRSLSQLKDTQSKKIESSLKSGQLLDDQVIIDLLLKSEELRVPRPLLLDGFPRNSMQWSAFKKLLGSPAAIIDLRVDESVIRKRLAGRQRFDDKPEIIDQRIKDYLNNTRLTADSIIDEYPDKACTIDSSNLNPDDVAEIARSFLYDLDLYPEERSKIKNFLQ